MIKIIDNKFENGIIDIDHTFSYVSGFISIRPFKTSNQKHAKRI